MANRSRTLLPPLLLAALVVGNCGDGGSTPTAPAAPAFEIVSAAVVVDGQVVNGTTVPAGHAAAMPTRFEARLQFGGQPASGGIVFCQFDLPNGGGGMMHRSGTFSMYDDGSHGDPVAGDGLYCYRDDAGQYGCHGNAAGVGEYHYEFWGQHNSYGETTHRQVTVTVR